MWKMKRKKSAEIKPHQLTLLQVREVYEELVEAEDIWTSFLAEVDSVINTNSVKPLKGSDDDDFVNKCTISKITN